MTDSDPYGLPDYDRDGIGVDLPRNNMPTDDLEMLVTFLESRWEKDDVLDSSYTTYEAKFAPFFQWLQENDLLDDPVQVDSTDVVKFAEDMSSEYSDTTVSNMLNGLSTFYNYFVRRSSNPEVTNPVRAAKEDLGISPSKREWPRVSLREMGDFLQSLKHPRDRAETLLFTKFGVRLSEAHNLDLHDVSIDFAPFNRDSYYASIETRHELEGRHDVIYIDPDIEAGKQVRGDTRKGGNKRKVPTYLPIDGELKHALVRWLAARPETHNHPTHPLFVGEYSHKMGHYRRHSLSDIPDRIRQRAEQMGWNDRDGNDITPHFFRHYFTTHHRLSMDDLLVDYIRGDRIGSQRNASPSKASSGKAKRDYTQAEWLNIKEPYLQSVYEFGLPRLTVTNSV
ncbi:tyrosine-type recombinase/integrase [Halobacteriaceae bacterium SHR40]|uniref:site-specific integrase n=1 Tax=Halovenus amylolytica TaxID=2500550 RepID=UPI000FE42DB8